MENEVDENIKEIISLRSKCYSILTINNKSQNKAKSISKNYCKKNHTHKYFKKFCLMKLTIIKQNFIEYL